MTSVFMTIDFQNKKELFDLVKDLKQGDIHNDLETRHETFNEMSPEEVNKDRSLICDLYEYAEIGEKPEEFGLNILDEAINDAIENISRAVEAKGEEITTETMETGDCIHFNNIMAVRMGESVNIRQGEDGSFYLKEVKPKIKK